jgi:hypothetical protein
MWCSFSAELVESSVFVDAGTILGESMPSQVGASFCSPPDQLGYIDWLELDRCPLVYVDAGSPFGEPTWVNDIAGHLREINAKLPQSWHPTDPTPALRDGIVTLKLNAEAAASHRTQNEEDW